MAVIPAPPVIDADRDVDVDIKPTVGDTDTLEEQHATLPLGKLRADFRPEEFERVLQQHGKYIIWRKACLCPCVREVTGQADLNCTDCDGSGFVYVDPIRIRAHMASFDKTTRLYEKFGLWVSGEVQVTVEQAYRLCWRDSLQMEDDVMGFNELIAKNDRKGRKSALGDDIDSARYRLVTLTKALVKSGTDILTLEVGHHLEVNVDGHIRWLGPGKAAVEDGAMVSLHYDFHPVWLVISHPHVVRSDVRSTKLPRPKVDGLPIQSAAQLDYLITDINKSLPTTGSIC